MKKLSERAFLACLMALLLAVPAVTLLWSRHKADSFYENRSLAPFPAVTAESLWDGGFGEGLESWYSDHAPARSTLLKADAAVQLKLLGRPVVNEIVATDDMLLPFIKYGGLKEADYRRVVEKTTGRFHALNAYIEDLGSKFLYVGIPEQRIYFEDRFPAYLNDGKASMEAADAVFAQSLREGGVDFLDMRAVFDGLGRPAEYYPAVDHHYNYYGAYAAYRAVMDHLAAEGFDLPVLTEEDLDFVELPNPYTGSRNRKLYNLWPSPDRAVVGIQKDPVAFTRRDNGEPSEIPLFSLPATEEELVYYTLYMGGDFGETVLKTDRPDLPDALIFGDSFTNAMETLLYASFNETRILDLRHYKEQSLKDYIAAYRPDIVISIQNDTFFYGDGTGNDGVWED